MKWRTPQNGDKRTFKNFAWLPCDLSSGETIWLEFYFETEEYYSYHGNSAWLTLKVWQ